MQAFEQHSRTPVQGSPTTVHPPRIAQSPATQAPSQQSEPPVQTSPPGRQGKMPAHRRTPGVTSAQSPVQHSP
jgi:hypothetical protein